MNSAKYLDPGREALLGSPLRCAGRRLLGAGRREYTDHFFHLQFTAPVIVGCCSRPCTITQVPTVAELLVVVDGLGEDAHAFQASELAVDTIYAKRDELHRAIVAADSDEQYEAALSQLFDACRQRFLHVTAEASDRNPTPALSVSMTVALWVESVCYVAHVGAGRAYFRDRQGMRRCTTDHTMAQRLFDEGVLDEEDPNLSRWRTLLWKVIGSEGDPVAPDFHRLDAPEGGLLLLCSDGVSHSLSDATIARELRRDTSPEEICRQLMLEVDRTGPLDCSTVVCAQRGIQGAW